MDVIVDKRTNSLIICDLGNKRLVQWSRDNGQIGKVIIGNIYCYGLAVDKDGDLYVLDTMKREVRRWKRGNEEETFIVSENEDSIYFKQSQDLHSFFIDDSYSVYVSTSSGRRIIKWEKGSKEGIVVAGSQNALIKTEYATGMFVNHLGEIFVADNGERKISCWSPESNNARVIVGANGKGYQPNQLNWPKGIAFDRQNNLYVADSLNHRV